MARRLNIFCVRQLMGFLVPEALFVSMGWGGKKRRMGGTWEEEEVNTTLLTNHLSCHHHPHVLTLSACLDSIAISIFIDILVEFTYTVSKAEIQITLLRQGALSTPTPIQHCLSPSKLVKLSIFNMLTSIYLICIVCTLWSCPLGRVEKSKNRICTPKMGHSAILGVPKMALPVPESKF